MATYSFHRLIMGKIEIGNFYCLIGDNRILFSQKCITFHKTFVIIAVLLQIFLQNFYINASFFSLLWLYLGNSQVNVYRTIGPTLVFFIHVLVT